MTGQNFIFFPAHPGNQQNCVQEDSVRRMQYETHAGIYNKHMLITQDCIKGRRCIVKSFLQTTLLISYM